MQNGRIIAISPSGEARIVIPQVNLFKNSHYANNAFKESMHDKQNTHYRQQNSQESQYQEPPHQEQEPVFNTASTIPSNENLETVLNAHKDVRAARIETLNDEYADREKDDRYHTRRHVIDDLYNRSVSFSISTEGRY